jgi:hypothetical protein
MMAIYIEQERFLIEAFYLLAFSALEIIEKPSNKRRKKLAEG